MASIETRELSPWLESLTSRLAIVLGSSINGLSFARSLGRRGVPVLLLDNERLAAAYGRYSKFVLLPPVDQCAEEWLALLEFVGANVNDTAFLFITTDAHIQFAARYERRLRRYFRFIIPDFETVECILNKRTQYGFAQNLGVPIPQICFPSTFEEVKHLSQNFEFPCILKPYVSHTARQRLAKRKVILAHSQAELIREYERLASADLQLMVQEIVPGADDALCGYLGFWDEHARERAWLTFRKLRQYPPGFGDGSLVETIQSPDVTEHSRRLLRAMNYRGFVEVEFKQDARDHTLRLMEINPRTSSFNQLAIGAGVDFPWIGHEHLAGRGQGSEGAGTFRSGVRYVDEELEFQALRIMARSGKLVLGDWIRSVWKARPIIFAWDDSMPILQGLWRLIRDLVSRGDSAFPLKYDYGSD